MHTMFKIFAGMILGLVIGASCRWFDIPLPGPPKLVGAFLVVSITFGYLATDKLLATKFSSKGPALTRDMCGGPNGEVRSNSVS
jgi:XapX domain-containing protein